MPPQTARIQFMHLLAQEVKEAEAPCLSPSLNDTLLWGHTTRRIRYPRLIRLTYSSSDLAFASGGVSCQKVGETYLPMMTFLDSSASVACTIQTGNATSGKPAFTVTVKLRGRQCLMLPLKLLSSLRRTDEQIWIRHRAPGNASDHLRPDRARG